MGKIPKQTESFNANYAKLQDIARQLRVQEEPDIDSLIPLVEDATKAYQACKERLAGVKSVLDEHFKEIDNDEVSDS